MRGDRIFLPRPGRPFLGEEREIPGERPFAKELVGGLLERGFDVAFSERLWLDHGTMVPLHFLNPGMSIPVVPIMVNNLYEPMVPPRRMHQLGAAMARAIEEGVDDRRVALLATGGLSHRVGTPDAGAITVELDEMFLDGVRRGEGSRLAELGHEKLAQAGNGTHEVCNWLCVMGALGDVPADFVTYEAAEAWVTGCAAAVWRRS